MPLTARSSTGARRRNPVEKLPEEPGDSTGPQVMAPTRMKLRVRRRDAAGGGAPPEEEVEQRRQGGTRSSRRKSAAAPATAPTPPPCPSSSSTAPLPPPEETSPDSKCPICLDRFNNLAYLDRCLHRFCFPCIQEWSHNKAECPLCKQPFASILHSVRAEDDFKEYTLRPPPASSSVAAAVAMVAAMASAARGDRLVRSALRRRGGAAADGGEEPWADSAEQGVMFQCPRRPRTHADRTSWYRIAGQALRRRLQPEGGGGGAGRRLRESEALAFRRSLYRYDMRVRGVAGEQQAAPEGDITAEGFRRNPALLNRLRPWLRRELTALYGPQRTLVDIVQRIIVAQLASHGLDHPHIQDELRPFLLARTAHFLHELVSFARSPLSLDDYDLQAQYEPPAAAALEPDELSSASDGSSVIAISEGEEEEEGGARPGGGGADDVTQTDGCLSLSVWDDEAPGPSRSTAPPPCDSAPPADGGEDECLIVGYKKPMAERTPELVQLSSDTEDEKDSAPKQAVAAATAPNPPLPTSPAPSPLAPDAGQPQEDVQAAARPCSASSGRSLELGVRDRKRARRRKRGRDLSAALSNQYGPATTRSPSPLLSGSASSSPPASSWEYGRSPPSSGASSLSSSSPLCLSAPSETPPPPGGHTHRAEKPGGKRKYKSRHLNGGEDDGVAPPPRRRRRGGGRGGRSPERREGTHRRRRVRSPSVEIIYEGSAPPTQAPPPRHRTRPRKQRRKSSSPVVITLDSDSSHDNISTKMAACGSSSSSISPLSSQQTVDFCDLPPLPLVHSAGVGGAMDPDVGELPVDILEGGSGAETAWADLRQTPPPPIRAEGVASEVCDTRLLATILGDLGGVSSPRPRPPRCAVRDWSAEAGPEEVTDPPSCHSSAPPLPPLHQMPLRVGEVTAQTPPPSLAAPLAPPLLRSASPVRVHNRNTPPPLKHKDAGSPRPLPHLPADPAPSDPAPSDPVPQPLPPVSALTKPWCLDPSPRLDLMNSFHWSEQRSSCDVTGEAPPPGLGSSPVDLRPAAVGVSKETPPLSTSRRGRTSASTSCRAAPRGLMSDGAVSPAGDALFSGVTPTDPSAPGEFDRRSPAADPAPLVNNKHNNNNHFEPLRRAAAAFPLRKQRDSSSPPGARSDSQPLSGGGDGHV